MLKEFINSLLKISILGLCLLTPVSFANQEIDEELQELECLAQNIFFEARGEPHKGKIAVGWVTINRVNHKNYPNSICGVVHQRNKYTCQFSWTCNKSKVKLIPEQLELSRKIAYDVYQKEVNDYSKGAIYFHNHTVEPVWKDEKILTVSIGNHKFYKDPKWQQRKQKQSTILPQ
jgi:N-acetylmuramoyl-L-alanine amidase